MPSASTVLYGSKRLKAYTSVGAGVAAALAGGASHSRGRANSRVRTIMGSGQGKGWQGGVLPPAVAGGHAVAQRNTTRLLAGGNVSL
ncbi:hypothetical protein D3C85_1566220 [compost metagenome]